MGEAKFSARSPRKDLASVRCHEAGDGSPTRRRRIPSTQDARTGQLRQSCFGTRTIRRFAVVTQGQTLTQWARPAYLDEWGPPVFANERYLFEEDMMKKHFDLRDWAGRQIAFIMKAALDELESLGLSTSDVRAILMKRLREGRKTEMEEVLRKSPIPTDQRDARAIAHSMMIFEACLGVTGEIMINTPNRFLRRFYGGDPWDRHLTGLILDIMGAEGEGFAAAINPNYTFRTNRYSCAGDQFDEWTIEPIDEESVGRHPRIPETDFDFTSDDPAGTVADDSSVEPMLGGRVTENTSAKTPLARRSLKAFERPDYLDRWKKPSFLLEDYAFNTPLIEKHRAVQFWAGNQIGFLTQAAIDELTARGRSTDDAIEALKRDLRDHFRLDTENFLREHPIKDSDRNARTIGHLIERWEAALGVVGETMINTPDRFIRRFYDPGDWYRLATADAIRVMLGGQGEGICLGVNPKFAFRLTRISASGDSVDEWMVERRDEEETQ